MNADARFEAAFARWSQFLVEQLRANAEARARGEQIDSGFRRRVREAVIELGALKRAADQENKRRGG